MQMKIVGHNKIDYTFTKNELKSFGFISKRNDIREVLESDAVMEAIMSTVMVFTSKNTKSEINNRAIPFSIGMKLNKNSITVTIEAMGVPFKIFNFDDDYCEEININDLDKETNIETNDDDYDYDGNDDYDYGDYDGDERMFPKEKSNYLLSFENLDDVIWYTSFIPTEAICPNSALYKFESKYYLICDFSRMSPETLDVYSMFAGESNAVARSVFVIPRIMEHGEIIIKEKAVEKLSGLI